jgi:RNA polymerase sigma factor for flagellar operon FliA
VRYVARRIHERLPAHVPYEDVLQAGIVGLLDAFRKFDPRKKVQIESYMKFRIRGAILDELRSLDWGPRELRRKGRQLEEAECRLRSRLGRTPGAAELAAEMRLPLLELHRLAGQLRGLELSSLQEITTTSEDGAEKNLESQVAAANAHSPFSDAGAEEDRCRLAAALQQLSARERLVLTLYYYEELTMKEIAEIISVGESRVSQIHSEAVQRLRAILTPENPRGAARTTLAAIPARPRQGMAAHAAARNG